ncbi:SDR family oxidoreductase [Catellatospora bangladeshensis]|uniref:SDR family oxidoreductase n=1 Tax=Catellatospora bangladeshensis TaxID=310355 RepID=UPI00360D848D
MGILITGADGYLGRRAVSALLETTGDEFVLAVRAADAAELAAKRDRLDAELGAAGHGRVTVVGADLTRDDALADVDPRRVTAIVHAAAVTRFSVDRETAQRVNVDGTVRLARFARRCPDLRRFTLLSTLYTAGGTPATCPSAATRTPGSSTSTSGPSGGPSSTCSTAGCRCRCCGCRPSSPRTTAARWCSTTPSTTRSSCSTTACCR